MTTKTFRAGTATARLLLQTGILLVCCLLLGGTERAALGTTLVEFDFSGVSGQTIHDKNTFEVTDTNTLHPNVSVVQGVNVFPPASPTFTTAGGSPSNDMNLLINASGTTMSGAIAGNHYLGYTIAPEPGFVLNLNNATFSFDFWRNGPNAAQNYYLLANVDGTGFHIGQEVATLTGVNNTDPQTISGTLPATGFGLVTGPVEVRLYANGTGGTSGGNTHFTGADLVDAEVFSGVLLATDFAGRTISGNTASNIPWNSNGLVPASNSLTVVNEAPGTLSGLFDTSDAQGYFAVAKNIGNEGPWSVTLENLSLDIPDGSTLELREVVLDWRHFSNAGNFQTVNRQADWTVTVTGSADGLIGTATGNTGLGTSGQLSIPFAAPLWLYDNQTYDVQLFVSSNDTSGNNTGLNGLMLLGSVVPEPSTYALGLLGAAGAALLVWRRRRKN